MSVQAKDEPAASVPATNAKGDDSSESDPRESCRAGLQAHKVAGIEPYPIIWQGPGRISTLRRTRTVIFPSLLARPRALAAQP